MRLDSHQHFWKFDPIRDTWINDNMEILKQDFFPGKSLEVLKKNNIDKCIAIQADQSEEETFFLLDLAKQYDFISGIVGWIDLKGENLNNRLDYFAQFSLIKGFRHILQNEPNDFILDKKFINGISYLQKYNFTYDILIYNQQLENIITLVKKFPNQKFVLDHLGKPLISQGILEPWKKNISQLAKCENVSCKISGMITEAKLAKWQEKDFWPYLDTVVECFGIDRVFYGSDYPVCLLSGSYQDQINIVQNYFNHYSLTEKNKIFGENASVFYHINI